jgi:hypothetical protein
MPRENSRERLVDGLRLRNDAGAMPERESEPTVAEMPTNAAGETKPLLYFDITVNTLKLAVVNNNSVDVTNITSITL